MKKIVLGAALGFVLVVGLLYVFRFQEEGEGLGELYSEQRTESVVVFPITEYASRRRVNTFGEKSQVTLEGYHTGDDIEYTDGAEEVPVFAIAAGVVRRSDRVRGYGGVLVIAHTI